MDRDKKITTYALIALAGILVIAGIVYFNARQKKEMAPLPSASQGATPEEVLKSLTAPYTAEPPEVPEEVIKSLTAPPPKDKKLPTVPEDVLKSLSAPR